MKNCLHEHFDKVLLLLIFLILVGITLHLAHFMADASIVNWAREETGTVLGALILAITGAARSVATNRSQKPEPPPVVPPPAEVQQ